MLSYVSRRLQITLAIGFLLGMGLVAWNSNRVAAASPTANVLIASAPSAPSLQDAPVTTPANAPPSMVPSSEGGINFLKLLVQGGWFMIPLGILSIAVVTIGIERFLALRRINVFPGELVDELSTLSQSSNGLEPRGAYQACQQYPSSASYVLRSMLVKVGRPQSEMETAISDSSQRETTRLAQMSSWLSLAAAVAPLIGLLGTVWGITQAFYDTTQLEMGQNRGVALASGIYVALVTTMVGLMIAIPSAILSHYYENRIVQLMNEIEEMAFNLLPQFERYEGQVRFTQGLDDESTQSESKAS